MYAGDEVGCITTSTSQLAFAASVMPQLVATTSKCSHCAGSAALKSITSRWPTFVAVNRVARYSSVSVVGNVCDVVGDDSIAGACPVPVNVVCPVPPGEPVMLRTAVLVWSSVGAKCV